MESKNFLSLQNIVTPEIIVEVQKKDTFFSGGSKFLDADDELLPIANWIKTNTQHNSEIKTNRIKYLYTTTAKKDGGRYILGTLSLRTEIEKIINDDFDYILFVHYKSWKELDIENKVIQLDKILCGVNIDVENKAKKQSVDSKEYVSNLHFFGPEKVLNSSEIIDMTVSRIIEQEKEEKKKKK